MKKVKLISGANCMVAEAEVNKWLLNNEDVTIIDIKFAVSNLSVDICILYEASRFRKG